MAVGNAVIDIVAKPEFLEHVRRMGLYMKQRLASVVDGHPSLVAEVRGEGLLLGIRCVSRRRRRRRRPCATKACSRPAAGDNVVRLVPPLIVTEAEIDEAIERLDRALAALAPARPARRGVRMVRHFLDLAELDAATLRGILDDGAPPEGVRAHAGQRGRSPARRSP